ncbi:MAG: lipopolysaccharide biosynthesis protein [Parcubacteria group bacterium Gr01-1014_38]|nr:MAG: lipopolysaccharide biosynthesis protein [Parcubacteria group bacterium Gr01-1014_38]
MSPYRIPFNRPSLSGKEFDYIREAFDRGQLSGNGMFTQRCHAWLKEHLGCGKVLLTHSCTAALEFCALLLDLQPGDEVIMPSFTFVSTANAFAVRGATPVFVDIRPDTLNLDETRIEAAISARTRAIVVVHYGGIGCEMDAIVDIARRHRLVVIEDAAHGMLATYRGRELGSIGHLAALSFHETKNITSGEGGALLINDDRYRERADTLWQKGTNRSAFARGETEKYTWVDLGSSFQPSEVTAAFLAAQLEGAESVTARRRAIWERYHAALAPLEAAGRVRRPVVPPHCVHNAHLYSLLLPTHEARDAFLAHLNARGIYAVFHYVPLHASPAGQRFSRSHGALPVTTTVGETLVRLPLWAGMTEEDVADVVRTAYAACGVPVDALPAAAGRAAL